MSFFAGGETIERAADGDAWSSWQLHDPRTESVHSHRCCVRRALHRRPLGISGFLRRHWLWHGYPAGRHYHLPVLWDLRQGTGGDGRHEHASVLNLTIERPAIVPLGISQFVTVSSGIVVVYCVRGSRVWVMCYLYEMNFIIK